MISYILIGINVIVYILILLRKLFLEDLADSYTQVFRYKEYYRILTSAFVHASIFHLLINMLALYNVGPSIEIIYGPFGFLLIYFGSIILGHLLALYIRHSKGQDDVVSVGASGAISGLIGALLVCYAYNLGLGIAIEELGITLLYMIIISFMPNVDGTAHISCFAVGIVLAFILTLI